MHYGRVPRIDVSRWSVTVSGATADGENHQLSYDDLVEMPQITVVADHHCVSRRTVQDVTWGGVPVRELVRRFPPTADAAHALVCAWYGYSASVTVADLEEPRALLALQMNGQDLAPEHGWPCRLVLPHLYGWKGPKWLLQIEYLRAPKRGFWEQHGYHLTGDVWREERYAHQE
ncbi:putative protein-methionine-sulfoxide reductase subunit YedZ1 [Austwickia sp. TVS 96-490-7B]|nr:putative protein-methionine-sulfoxide reductase subunit YedZ1 [Austwickia sp. TVS 96-490-7B]